MDTCTTYKCFTTRTLMAGKTVDVFFAALKKLAVLFGGLPEQTFVYAFVAELLAQVKQLLRAFTSIKAMPTEQLLEYVDQKATPLRIMCDQEIRRECSSRYANLQWKKDKGCAVHHLSERDSELNQKQMTFKRGRAHPFFSTPSFDWFWYYVAKCLDG